MAHESRAQVELIATQIGSSLKPDNRDYTNRFTVKSTSSSSVYLVSQRQGSGQWCCSCPGWIHHRKCKHLKDILSRLAALPVPAKVLDAGVLAMLASARTAYLDLDGPKPVNVRMTADRVLDL
jgi:hypothetical protein